MDINRKTAYDTLVRIEYEGAYSNIALNHQISENSPDSPAFVREIVYGVLTNRIYLDYILDLLAAKGLRSMRREPHILLQMGLYQLIFMDSVPEYAAVNETVKLARDFSAGREGLINGVLRGYIRRKDQIVLPDPKEDLTGYLSVKYSYARWIAALWTDQYGPEKAERLLKAGNRPPELSLRVNISKISREDLSERLRAKGFDVRDGKLSSRCLFAKGSGLLSTSEYKEGLFSVQDQSSIAAVDILSPEKGDTVIDVCASAGGKTFAMAEKMMNEGRIVSCDIYENKLRSLRKEAVRLSSDIIETCRNDGTVMRKEWEGKADKVVVDAPCSGLGAVRKKPEIKFRILADNGKELAAKQSALLDVSSRYVKKGGRLLYCTCTINKTENAGVASGFLSTHKGFELERSRQFLLGADETDGFFICLMRRRG